MALNDVLLYDDGVSTFPSAKRFNVKAMATSTATSKAINAGEFVLKIVGGKSGTQSNGSVVTAWGNSVTTKPEVGTDFLAGLAVSTSTETSTVAGTVDIIPVTPGLTFLVKPDTAATWDTQSEYDALVGYRVKLSTSATGVQTLLAADYLWNGFVVEPLDVLRYPGRVRVSAISALNYLTAPVFNKV